MRPLDWLLHAANFLAPALGVALVVTLAARLSWPARARAWTWRASLAINFAAGAAVLAAGLAYFGADGKMATYGALMLACATSQWLLLRGWRG